MKVRIAVAFIAIASLFLSSCGLIFSEDAHKKERTEAIVSALQNEDKEALKSLFSKKALDEIDDFDSQFDAMLRFCEGSIASWEKAAGSLGDTSSGAEGKTVMLLYEFHVFTDVDAYDVLLIDYAVDTIDPNNKGLYMLEICKASYDGERGPWQERMKAGISILE